MSWAWELGIAALIAALVQCVLHWFPWRLASGQDLPRTRAYALGVLGIVLPYSGLLLLWIGEQSCGVLPALIGIWVIVAASGGAVNLAYWLDQTFNQVRLADELEEILRLQEGRDDQAGQIDD